MTDQQSIRLAFSRVLDGQRTRLVRFRGSVRTQGPRVDHYLVDSASRPDAAYRVTVQTNGHETYSCTCPASLHAACWHRAAVAAVRANRQAAGLPPAGPSAAQERERAAFQAEQQRRAQERALAAEQPARPQLSAREIAEMFAR